MQLDSTSNSEIVAPIVVNGTTVAVLDIDSPLLVVLTMKMQRHKNS